MNVQEHHNQILNIVIFDLINSLLYDSSNQHDYQYYILQSVGVVVSTFASRSEGPLFDSLLYLRFLNLRSRLPTSRL